MVAKGCGEEGMECIEWVESQFYKMKSILEMDGGNGYTTVSMYFISLNSALQIAKMVHFLLCAFYHK